MVGRLSLLATGASIRLVLLSLIVQNSQCLVDVRYCGLWVALGQSQDFPYGTDEDCVLGGAGLE